jgi:hypothetical protein
MVLVKYDKSSRSATDADDRHSVIDRRYERCGLRVIAQLVVDDVFVRAAIQVETDVANRGIETFGAMDQSLLEQGPCLRPHFLAALAHQLVLHSVDVALDRGKELSGYIKESFDVVLQTVRRRRWRGLRYVV